MSYHQTPTLLHIYLDSNLQVLLSDAFRDKGIVVTDWKASDSSIPLSDSFDYVVINTLSEKSEDTSHILAQLVQKVSEYIKEKNTKIVILLEEGSVLKETFRSYLPASALLVIAKNNHYSTERLFTEKITRSLLSLSAYGQEEVIQGVEPKRSEKIEPLDTTDNTHEKSTVISPEVLPEKKKRQTLKQMLSRKAKKNKKVTKKVTHITKKRILVSIIVCIALLFVPYILAVSGFIFSLYTIGHTSDWLLSASHNTNKTTESIAYLYVQQGAIFNIYNDALGITRASEGLISASQKEKEAKQLVEQLTKDISSTTPFSISDTVRELMFSLDAIYSNLGFSLAELEAMNRTQLILGFIDRTKIEKKREEILQYKKIVKNLPEVLGAQNLKTYAFVVQDEEVLRSTGGKIDALALVTFEDGQIVEVETFTINKSENNLSGLISPPLPISKYLKKTNWSLENANWDVSYSEAAERIIWFIDKELDRKVDGVIVVSQSTLKDILQKQKKEDGTYDNQTLLQSGIPAFITAIANSDSIDMLRVLADKHVLLSTSNAGMQEAFDALSWSGRFPQATCEGNCFIDHFGIVEANFGEANSHIRREAELKTSLEEGILKRKLTYYIKNQTDSVYKAYVRVFTLENSGFSPVTVLKVDGNSVIDPEVYGSKGMKEAGVYVEIPGKKTYGLEYGWESASTGKFDANGTYILSVFKQPGVTAYPFSATLAMPPSKGFSFESSGFLTKGDGFAYNSVLTEDLKEIISWTK